MNNAVTCPRCQLGVEGTAGCQHLRWTPDRGSPVEFAKHIVQSSPYTKGRGFRPDSIPPSWWETKQDWLLDRILARLDVAGGYCFGDIADIDGLCMDIWHEIAPDADRRLSAAQALEE